MPGRTPPFRDARPLLESEFVDASNAVPVVNGVTLVKYVGADATKGVAGHLYKYVGSNAELVLPNQNYLTASWQDVTGALTGAEVNEEKDFDSSYRPPIPAYATGSAYSIRYVQLTDLDIKAIQNVTRVLYVGATGDNGENNHVYKYVGPDADLELPAQDYKDNPDFWLDITASITDPDGDNTHQIAINPDDYNNTNERYKSNYVNFSVKGETWTTGGGWMREKTVHTKIDPDRGPDRLLYPYPGGLQPD